MGFFSSKQKSESSSKTKPWDPTAAPLTSAAYGLGQWMNKPQEFFPGQTYAGQTAAEAQAIEQLKAGAGAYPGMVSQFMPSATGAMTGALGAPQAALGMGLTDVTTNPAVQAQAQAIQDQLNRNLQENILPNIGTRQAAMGTLGSARQGLAEGVAGRGTQEALATSLADLYGGAYQAGLGAETARYGAGLGAAGRAMGQLPGLAQFGLTQYTQPAALLGQAGGLERAEEQRGITEAMRRHEFEQMEPYRRKTMGIQSLMPMATGFGETEAKEKVTSSPSTMSNLGNVLSMAGGLGSAITGGPGFLSGLGNLFGGNPYQAEPMMGGYGTMGSTSPWSIGGDQWGYGGLYG